MCASLRVHKSSPDKTITLHQVWKVQHIEYDVPYSRNITTTSGRVWTETEEGTVTALEQTTQSRAEQQRLLTAELIQSRFLVKRKISAAILPQRQHDNNMRNSPKEQVCLTDFHCGWLMSLWHSQHCSIVQASAAFQSPDVIECVFFMKLQWPLIKHMKSSALIVGQVRKPTCSNQLDDK